MRSDERTLISDQFVLQRVLLEQVAHRGVLAGKRLFCPVWLVRQTQKESPLPLVRLSTQSERLVSRNARVTHVLILGCVERNLRASGRRPLGGMVRKGRNTG